MKRIRKRSIRIDMLELDQENHIYYFNGVKMPSVTQILQAVGMMNVFAYDEFAKKRGSAIHKATEYFDEGDLDEDSISQLVRPYLEAWKTFRKDTGFEPLEIEKSGCDPILGVAGTWDRFGMLNGCLTIEETKSGTIPRYTAIQTAFYKIIKKYELKEDVPINRIGVELRPNATYRVEEFKNWRDEKIAMSALAIYNWSRNK
jgi:hypothetical protein